MTSSGNFADKSSKISSSILFKRSKYSSGKKNLIDAIDEPAVI